VSARETSADSGPTMGSTTRGAYRRTTGRLALLRAKVATIGLAVALFVATLTGIAVYNPQVSKQSAAPLPTQQIIIVEPSGSDSLQLPSPPHVSAVRPFARSRGS
jgi:hypothetical protein